MFKISDKSAAFKRSLLAGAATLALGATQASAGGFGLHEQSAEALGEAFAGVAAGAGGLSAMFWNPATLTQNAGLQTSTSLSLIVPYASDTFVSTNATGTFLGIGALPSPGNGLTPAVLPASYVSYQVNDQLWLGLSVNSPFGFSSKNKPGTAAGLWGLTTTVFTTDITPELAFKINDWISVGVGVQAMYTESRESQNVFLPSPPFPAGTIGVGVLKGSSWGFGFTAGVTLKPIDGTEIGIGYRSQVREGLKGKLAISIPAVIPISATLNLPQSVNVGLRQRITPQFTLLAGVEWMNWSTLQNLTVSATAPVPALGVVTGQNMLIQNLNYRDGWMFSLGGEYMWDKNLTLRAGAAYEQSPVTNANRDVRLLDSDRFWLSLGASYKVSNKLKFDVSYAHVFYQSGTITIPAAPGGLPVNPVSYNGTSSARGDVISVGFTYRWDEPVAAVVAKY